MQLSHQVVAIANQTAREARDLLALQARHFINERQMGREISLVKGGRIFGLFVEGDEFGHKAPWVSDS